MSNIVKFELKQGYKSLIGWLGGALLLSLVYISVYPVFRDSIDEFQTILDAFPQEVLIGLGMDVTLFTSFEGYYIFILSLVSLVAFSFAATISLKMFSKEYRNKSIEFLFTKPKKRLNIYTQKVVATALLISIFFIVLTLVNYIIAVMMDEVDMMLFVQLNLTVYFIMLVGSMVCINISIIFNKIRSSGGVGFLIAIAFYFFNVLGDILEIDALNYISIYGLFDTNTIADDGITLAMIIPGVVVYIGLYLLGLVLYKRKDVL